MTTTMTKERPEKAALRRAIPAVPNGHDNAEWFSVDREGLAKILKRKGVEFAVFELIQNAWDEPGVTKVEASLMPVRGGAILTVTDDAPEGFKDLTHAYTLFAESAKKNNPVQRGRFNLGEKLVLALCHHASIITTKGTILFGAGGRMEKPERTESGSTLSCELEITPSEIEQIKRAVKQLLSPATIRTTFNGEVLLAPERDYQFETKLRTEAADEEGHLRPTHRKTTVNLYKVAEGDTARIYEMGIPVVEHDCAWHCDVQQKVPLTLDRENVQNGFLQALHTAVFNHMHAKLDQEEMNNQWAQTAVESPDVKPEAVQNYVEKRFGEKRVSFDMNDREANNTAVAAGYTLVHGGMMSGDAWKNVKAAEAIAPAGQLFPTPGADVKRGATVDANPAMERVGKYAQHFAEIVLGTKITVRFATDPLAGTVASYGGRQLMFNVGRLGKRWFDLDKNRLAIDDLIVHELGHEYEANHLSKAYNDALTRIAARAIQAAREGRLA